MSLVRSAAIVLVTGLLFVSVVGANGTIAAQQTVLDDEYVTDRLDASNVSATVGESLTEQMVGTVGGTKYLTSGVQQEIDAYVAAQTDDLVTELYAYLHGDRSDLALTVETDPLVENLSEAAEQRVRQSDPIELYRNVSDEPIADTNQSIVTTGDLARLDDNASAYRAVRSDVRADLRERAVRAIVDRLYAEATTDELLALVIDGYDPTAYTEAEKQQLVDEHEAEIRAALEQRVRSNSGDEIDRRVQDRLDAMTQMNTTDSASDNVSAAARALGNTYAVGIAGTLDYAAFDQQLRTAQNDLAAAVGDRVAAELDSQLPEQVSLAERIPAQQRSQLETLASVVQLLDALVFVFPVIGIAAIGLLYLLTRSIGRTTGVVGGTIAVAGGLSVGGTIVARMLIVDRLAALPGPIGDLLESLVGGAIGHASAQSLVVLLAGLAVVGIAVAARYRTTEDAVDPMA
ncbi:MAG: hypothetical protein ABEJ86_05030 [Halococcoides sp.]